MIHLHAKCYVGRSKTKKVITKTRKYYNLGSYLTLRAKNQGQMEVMMVCDIPPYTCIPEYKSRSKDKKVMSQTPKYYNLSRILTLRSKVKVKQRS